MVSLLSQILKTEGTHCCNWKEEKILYFIETIEVEGGFFFWPYSEEVISLIPGVHGLSVDECVTLNWLMEVWIVDSPPAPNPPPQRTVSCSNYCFCLMTSSKYFCCLLLAPLRWRGSRSAVPPYWPGTASRSVPWARLEEHRTELHPWVRCQCLELRSLHSTTLCSNKQVMLCGFCSSSGL